MTQETKHTPGPWSVVYEHPYTYVQERAHGNYLAQISHINDTYEFDSPLSSLEEQANARLIAASPDLLKALENIEIWMSQDGPIDRMGYDCELASIRAAVAKAKGE